jgi:uncharacterized membrane protein
LVRAQALTLLDRMGAAAHRPGLGAEARAHLEDSADTLRQHAQNVYQQVVVTRQMPMNNATGITEEERATIGRWFQAGAKAD